MRARIAIYKAKQPILLRDIVLSDKPEEMLFASPKGTVPVLVIDNENLGGNEGTVDNRDITDNKYVIEESLEIMLWVLKQNDPNDLLHKTDPTVLNSILSLIEQFDTEFKTCLEQYKCAKRYRENNIVECRQACEVYLTGLEQRLEQHKYLISDNESLADIALLPFIRQLARIERQWYLQSPYPKLKTWLNHYLQSPMFTKVMAKYPLWLDTQESVIFVGK